MMNLKSVLILLTSFLMADGFVHASVFGGLDAITSNPVLDRSESLSGEDANKNGVRDDVEKYIDSKSDTPIQKQSLRLVSKAMTAAMTSTTVQTPNNQAALVAATNMINMAMACVWKHYPSSDAHKMNLEIKKITVNTKPRYDAYMRHSALTSGAVIKAPRDVVCD